MYHQDFKIRMDTEKAPINGYLRLTIYWDIRGLTSTFFILSSRSLLSH